MGRLPFARLGRGTRRAGHERLSLLQALHPARGVPFGSRRYSHHAESSPSAQSSSYSEPPPKPLPGARLFIWGTIGINIGVFTYWAAARQEPQTAKGYQRIMARRQYMYENFTLSQENLRNGRYWTLITNAYSHADLGHLAFNMITFHTFSTIGFWLGLGLRNMSIIAAGSMLTSSLGSLLDESTRIDNGAMLPRASLGASGMVQGIGTAVTLVGPRVPISLMFIPIAFPLWVATAGFIAYDYYRLLDERRHGQKGQGRSIGYAAHLGGAVFGAAFYLLRLRFKFGGVLPSRIGGR